MTCAPDTRGNLQSAPSAVPQASVPAVIMPSNPLRRSVFQRTHRGRASFKRPRGSRRKNSSSSSHGSRHNRVVPSLPLSQGLDAGIQDSAPADTSQDDVSMPYTSIQVADVAESPVRRGSESLSDVDTDDRGNCEADPLDPTGNLKMAYVFLIDCTVQQLRDVQRVWSESFRKVTQATKTFDFVANLMHLVKAELANGNRLEDLFIIDNDEWKFIFLLNRGMRGIQGNGGRCGKRYSKWAVCLLRSRKWMQKVLLQCSPQTLRTQNLLA